MCCTSAFIYLLTQILIWPFRYLVYKIIKEVDKAENSLYHCSLHFSSPLSKTIATGYMWLFKLQLKVDHLNTNKVHFLICSIHISFCQIHMQQHLLLETALSGFRSYNPPWLRLSQNWDYKPLRRQSLSPWQVCHLCSLYFTLLGPELDQLANDR